MAVGANLKSTGLKQVLNLMLKRLTMKRGALSRHPTGKLFWKHGSVTNNSANDNCASVGNFVFDAQNLVVYVCDTWSADGSSTHYNIISS